jgi:hypothetical protein
MSVRRFGRATSATTDTVVVNNSPGNELECVAPGLSDENGANRLECFVFTDVSRIVVVDKLVAERLCKNRKCDGDSAIEIANFKTNWARTVS